MPPSIGGVARGCRAPRPAAPAPLRAPCGQEGAPDCAPVAHRLSWSAATPAGVQQQRWRQAAKPARRSVVSPRASTADSDGGLDEARDDVEERRWVRALVLAYHASLNRSLFAAKCLVEVVVEMYREGVTLDDAKVMLSLASLQHGGQLLAPMDEDILLSWVAVIMISLQLVGVPLKPEGEERMRQLGRQNPADDESGMIAGLRGMVRVSVDQFLAGTDLFRLQLQQGMAGQAGDAGGPSPAVFMLQQNTRLAIITLEVVRGMGLPTAVPLAQQPAAPAEGEEQVAEAGSGALQQQQHAVAQRSWVPGFVLACDPVALARSSEAEQQRAAAVRLLIAFMGATQGWLVPAWDFISHCTECYGRGWTADALYSRLRDEEFAQSGGLAVDAARTPGHSNLTAAVFARWLSIVFMTLAQLGVVFPGASQRDGWAWVAGAAEMHAHEEGGHANVMEAYGLADFVLHALQNEAQKDGAGGAAPGTGMDVALAPPVEGLLARQPAEEVRRQARAGFVTLEDPQLLPTSPSVLLMSQQISLVQMTRQLVLQERTLAVAPGPAA